MDIPDVSRVAISPDRPVPEEYELLCDGCGYSLIGLMIDRCPECGQTFDPTALPLARVPWLYRQRLGTVVAYSKTVWMVLTQPRVFAKEVSRPVRISADDARRFRWTTIRIVAVLATLAGFAVSWLILKEMGRFKGRVPVGAYVLALAVPIVAGVVLWAALAMSTDMPTFIWRGIDSASPDDLGPLHHYASAPLVLIPLWSIIAVCGAWLIGTSGSNVQLAAAVVVTVFAFSLFALLWVTPAVMMQAATGCSWGRAALLALYLPGHWFMMFFIAGGIFGFTVAGLRMLFE
jgi:hypothetical protein